MNVCYIYVRIKMNGVPFGKFFKKFEVGILKVDSDISKAVKKMQVSPKISSFSKIVVFPWQLNNTRGIQNVYIKPHTFLLHVCSEFTFGEPRNWCRSCQMCFSNVNISNLYQNTITKLLSSSTTYFHKFTSFNWFTRHKIFVQKYLNFFLITKKNWTWKHLSFI